ncbi:hypothetical protein BKI52_01175 [marine bacterium AO1-C]|nr:hypothetical protein BKI52_01175 [marine bacterium AO1-C]
MNRLIALVFSLILFPVGLKAQLPLHSKAPEIVLENIYGPNAPRELPTLASFKNKVVVLDFWATWCGPCIASFPKISRLHKKYKHKGVRFLAITNDSKQKLENFFQERKVDFWIGRSKVDFRNYKVTTKDGSTTIPRVCIINREGKVAYWGSKLSEKMIEDVIATGHVITKVKTELATKPVIRYGRFRAGEDPLYNGAWSFAFPKKKMPNTVVMNQFVIRPSLGDFGGIAISRGKAFKISIIKHQLTEALTFLSNLSSPVWIDSKVADQFYDIIYSKFNQNQPEAFKEIKDGILDGLALQLKPITKVRAVNLLSIKVLTKDLIRPESEIKDGTYHLYASVKSVIAQLERKTGKYFLADKKLHQMFLRTNGLNIWKESAENILAFLRKNKYEIKRVNREVTTYELSVKN